MHADPEGPGSQTDPRMTNCGLGKQRFISGPGRLFLSCIIALALGGHFINCCAAKGREELQTIRKGTPLSAFGLPATVDGQDGPTAWSWVLPQPVGNT